MGEDWDLLFGAIINLGDRPTTPTDPMVAVLPRSEFGTYPSSLFLQIKTFF